MPEEAELEEDHGRHRFSAGGFLMGFLGCTDAVPEHLRVELARVTGIEEQSFRTCARAHHLLVFRGECYARGRAQHREQEWVSERAPEAPGG